MVSLGVSKSTPALGDLLALSMELCFLMAGIHHEVVRTHRQVIKEKDSSRVWSVPCTGFLVLLLS